jgi:hypothetical protein
MAYWYISFATDDAFLGATVVEAASSRGAFDEATRRGINPGGNAAIVGMPEDCEDEADVQAMLNRLVHKDELLAMGGRARKDCPPEVQDAFDAAADHICVIGNRS